MQSSQLSSPFVMVIFGATGDLTQRKLLPALFHLFQKKLLPEHFFIVGFSRRAYSTEDFKEFLKSAVLKYDPHYSSSEGAKRPNREVSKDSFSTLRQQADRSNNKNFESVWQEFCGRIYYQQGEFEEEKGYRELIEKLAEFDAHLTACVPRYFYLATPPDKYWTILKFLDQTKLSEGCGQGSDKWTKVMVEKPFGRDMADAKALDELLAKIFKEEQIYRIDHYLGKETVQNILAFRYSNAFFDPVWNRQFIDYVQITIAETLGVETRGNFFEGVGTLRDMAQSHLLELMAAIAMKPKTYSSEGIRQARAEIIASINSIRPAEVKDNVVRGQYGSSQSAVRSQQLIKSYREEPNVDSKSNTETFVALKLTLNDPRWEGVPFYMRTGKRLFRKATEISVVLKQPRHELFKVNFSLSDPPAGGESKGNQNVSLRQAQAINNYGLAPDILTFRIDPNEGIELKLNAKQTGFRNDFEVLPLSFTYRKETELPEAYERLLLDAMRGDQTLFTRTDEVASAWKFIGNIIEGWNKEKPDFPNYTPGSWGPEAADQLIEKDGRKWLLK